MTKPDSYHVARRHRPAAIASAILLLMLCSSTFANEPAHEGAGEHAGEHKKHTLGLFFGVTREDGHNLETLGIEYAYRIAEKWTIGGIVERADRKKDSTLIIATAAFWPYKGLFLSAGIGRKDPGEERETTIRGSIGYEFIFGRGWILAPQVAIDWIENHPKEEVIGVAIGKQF